jgi:hypothetical protein
MVYFATLCILNWQVVNGVDHDFLFSSFSCGAQSKGKVPVSALFDEFGSGLGPGLLLGQWAFGWVHWFLGTPKTCH